MTTDRSYRRGLTHERAIEILREYAGIQFDPASSRSSQSAAPCSRSDSATREPAPIRELEPAIASTRP